MVIGSCFLTQRDCVPMAMMNLHFFLSKFYFLCFRFLSIVRLTHIRRFLLLEKNRGTGCNVFVTSNRNCLQNCSNFSSANNFCINQNAKSYSQRLQTTFSDEYEIITLEFIKWKCWARKCEEMIEHTSIRKNIELALLIG